MKKLTFMIIGIVAVALVLSGTVMAGGKGKGKKKLKLTDEYLSGPCFQKDWGPGSIDSVLDLKKKGVGFALSSLDGVEGTGIRDDWWGPCPIGPDPAAGGAEHPDHTGAFTDFSAYSKLELEFQNLGTADVMVNVFINTGFTESGWDTCEGGGWACDTYYEGTWTTVPAGKKKKVKLDFSDIVRLNEVTAIGFQVIDPDDGVDGSDNWIVVKGGGGGKDNDGDSDSN